MDDFLKSVNRGKVLSNALLCNALLLKTTRCFEMCRYNALLSFIACCGKHQLELILHSVSVSR